MKSPAPFEDAWRQKLQDYRPAAEEADWKAMKAQLHRRRPLRDKMPWILVCLLLTILAAYLSVTLAETPANIRDISEFSIIIPAADPHVGGDPDISSTVEVTQSVSSSGSEGGIVPAVQPLGVVSPPLHTPLPSLHHSPVAVDRLPSYRYRPVSQTRTDRLEELGKSLIVVPPAKARILPEDYNGLYPPLRRRKN